jgi:hypothetical protein
MEHWLETQPNTLYSDGMKKLVDHSTKGVVKHCDYLKELDVETVIIVLNNLQ